MVAILVQRTEPKHTWRNLVIVATLALIVVYYSIIQGNTNDHSIHHLVLSAEGVSGGLFDVPDDGASSSTAASVRGSPHPSPLADKVASSKFSQQVEKVPTLTGLNNPSSSVKDTPKLKKSKKGKKGKEKKTKQVLDKQNALTTLSSEVKTKSSGDDLPPLGTLTCDAHGGPQDQSVLDEMVYWRDIPQDDNAVSPYTTTSRHGKGSKKKQRKYLSVEVDEGGWNNIRMMVECAMVMARATGRTFVIPPQQGMFLLKDSYTLHDFYNMEGLDVIEMKDFLEQEVLTGNIRDRTTGKVAVPPHEGRTDWRVSDQNGARELDYFIRTIGLSPRLCPGATMMIIPSRPDSSRTEEEEHQRWLKKLHAKAYRSGLETRMAKAHDNPLPVNATVEDRLTELVANRGQFWVFDAQKSEAPLVHFMAEDKEFVRIFGHFYYVFFFEDWRMDLMMKRYVRDKLRYRDELFCAAARIVDAVRTASRKNGSPDGVFYSYHIRRGDFAWISLVDTAHEILNTTSGIVPDGSTVYIATDEQDLSWFEPMEKRFDVHYLSMYKHLIEGFSTNLFGMIDQIIAARGEAFIGAHYSTMTAHVNHLRGYYSQKENRHSPDWELGLIDSYIYAPAEHRDSYRHYIIPDESAVERAYASGWRMIDEGIE